MPATRRSAISPRRWRTCCRRPSRESHLGLADWVEDRLLTLRGLAPEEQADRVASYWDELDTPQRFLLNKLIGGSFRVGVSKLLVKRALAEGSGVDAKLVAQRMMGYTDGRVTPSAERYTQLTSSTEAGPLDLGQPYPFFLAHQLDLLPEQFEARLASPGDWIVEWKYDGIRAQLVKRASQVWIWSRGEELVTERFPEIVAAASSLPNGTVLDGEAVVWKDGKVASFALLQQRIGRKTLTKKVLADAPVGFIAYDILELDGADLRDRPQSDRRSLLERLVAGHPTIHLSPVETRTSWQALAELRTESRARGVEGFMLKHRDARYGTGRRKQDDLAGGTWWKWKIDPLSIDCVLIYAQAGHGRRASVYTDYTFAVWNRTPKDAAEAQAVVEAIAAKRPPQPGDLQLVAFAKAYSGLTDEEFKAVDKVIRATTLEKFGPVRSVPADDGLRARLRGHQPELAAQERHRHALPAHAAHPRRQAAARGRHDAVARGAAGLAPRNGRGGARGRHRRGRALTARRSVSRRAPAAAPAWLAARRPRSRSSCAASRR